MSSLGILDNVSPEWLQEKLGSSRKWSSDSITKTLDGPMLQRLSDLWPTLPGGQQVVVKQRILFALLTLKTPFAEDVLTGARNLLATALKDASPEAQVNMPRLVLAYTPACCSCRPDCVVVDLSDWAVRAREAYGKSMLT